MNLEQLTAGMPELVKITGNAQMEIKTLTADSRAKCESGLFFCIRGGRVDAHGLCAAGRRGRLRGAGGGARAGHRLSAGGCDRRARRDDPHCQRL